MFHVIVPMPRGVSGNPAGRPVSIEPVSLEHAKDAMLAAILAEEELVDAIVLAISSGNSAHQVAKALGMSHQTVLAINVKHSRPSPKSKPLHGSWKN